MALTSPALLVETNLTNTATFAAQTAGSFLVAVATRNDGVNDTVIPLPSEGGWFELGQRGGGVPASSAERVAIFGKEAVGTETSVTFASNMGTGTRGITVFSTAVPAGGGGSWVLQATKVVEALTVVGLTVGDSADLTSTSDDTFVVACYQQSSSYAVTGNMPAYPGMTVRGTAAVGRGRPATAVPATRNVAVDVKAVAVTDTRRLSFVAAAVAYIKKPTTAVTAPTAGATVSGATVAVTATATGGNCDTTGIEFYLETGATDTVIGVKDTVSPYSVTWDTTGLANGSQTVRALWYGSAELGLAGLQFSSDVTVTVSNAAPSTSNIIAWKYHNGTAWVDVIAIRQHLGGVWTNDIWP